MMERSPLQYLSCMVLGKVTFNEHVNALEMYCKGDIRVYQTLIALFPEFKVEKGLIKYLFL